LTIIDGGYVDLETYIDRVFHITGAFTVEISHLTIQKGFAAVGSFGGGGILNQGTLTLRDVSMQNNHAKVVGGGMDNYRGTATITNSSISGNTSTEDGGGIFNDGYLTLTSSTLAENMAVNGGGGLDNRDNAMLNNVSISGNTALSGGGIFSDGQLLLSNSTLSVNTASNSGGGLENRGSGTMVNATISGNTASEGGGLFNLGELVVRYTTIVANTATAALGNKGGNIENANSIRIKTSLVADSLAGPNCHGSAITSLGHNLENEDTCNFHGVGDLENQTNPGIDPLLTDNEGPTLTHALLQDSPAIDAGDDSECPTKDQRGAYRPSDGDGNGDAKCDIGAYEYEGVFPKFVFAPTVAR
jgi:predicted outer membrane repeat protein